MCDIHNLLCVLCGFQAWSHTQYSVCEGISEQVPTVVWLRWCSCSYNIASFPGSPCAFPYCKWRKAGRGLGTRLVTTQEKQSVLCLCQLLFKIFMNKQKTSVNTMQYLASCCAGLVHIRITHCLIWIATYSCPTCACTMNMIWNMLLFILCDNSWGVETMHHHSYTCATNILRPGVGYFLFNAQQNIYEHHY